MKKIKVTHILLVIIILLFIIGVYVFARKANAPVPINQNQNINPPLVIDNTMPLLEDKTQILGQKDDLISFSILPFTKVHGILSYRGVIKGGYFFEGNIIIKILDVNKKVLKTSNAVAKEDWMTAGPVNFEGNIDFTGLEMGPAYFEIHNDNASGLPKNDKSILIPIIID